jgi:hypothetical protein
MNIQTFSTAPPENSAAPWTARSDTQPDFLLPLVMPQCDPPLCSQLILGHSCRIFISWYGSHSMMISCSKIQDRDYISPFVFSVYKTWRFQLNHCICFQIKKRKSELSAFQNLVFYGNMRFLSILSKIILAFKAAHESGFCSLPAPCPQQPRAVQDDRRGGGWIFYLHTWYLKMETAL